MLSEALPWLLAARILTPASWEAEVAVELLDQDQPGENRRLAAEYAPAQHRRPRLPALVAPINIRRIDVYEALNDCELARKYDLIELYVIPSVFALEEAGTHNRFVAVRPDGWIILQIKDITGTIIGYVRRGDRCRRGRRDHAGPSRPSRETPYGSSGRTPSALTVGSKRYVILAHHRRRARRERPDPHHR